MRNHEEIDVREERIMRNHTSNLRGSIKWAFRQKRASDAAGKVLLVKTTRVFSGKPITTFLTETAVRGEKKK